MEAQVVGGGINFFQLGQAYALFFRHPRGNERIVRDHFHPESPRPPGDFHPDSSQSHDARRLASQFSALKRFLLPLAGVHQLIGAADMASHGQHQGESVLRHGNGIGAWRVHDRYALAGGGVQIDVVHAHPGAANHPQFAGMFEQCGVHLHRRSHDQRIR